jgi:hypothetical protein
MSTSALYLAYVIPILLNLRNRYTKRGEYTTSETAPWNLGGYVTILNAIAIAGIAVITVLFSIPPNELAGLTLGALGLVLLMYWQFWQRRRFVGPRPPTAEQIVEQERQPRRTR